MSREKINVPMGFISGTVKVNGLPNKSSIPVEIRAESGEPSAIVTAAHTVQIPDSRGAVPYCLLVFPGRWKVHAAIYGNMASPPKEITVSSGETCGLDFVFG